MHGGSPVFSQKSPRGNKTHPGQLKASRCRLANRLTRQRQLANEAAQLGITPSELKHQKVMEGHLILKERAAERARYLAERDARWW